MIRFFCISMLVNCFVFHSFGNEVIRINQMGYLPEGLKKAVFLSDQDVTLLKFKLVENISGKTVFEGIPIRADGGKWGQKSAYRLNFSSVVQPGGYHLEASKAISSPCPIRVYARQPSWYRPITETNRQILHSTG